MARGSKFTNSRFVELLNFDWNVGVLEVTVYKEPDEDSCGDVAIYCERRIVSCGKSFEARTERQEVLAKMLERVAKNWCVAGFGDGYFRDTDDLTTVCPDTILEDAIRTEKILSEKREYQYEVAGETMVIELASYHKSYTPITPTSAPVPQP